MVLFSKSTRTYLDYASAAPVSARARKAFIDALGVDGNPSSPHAEGIRAHELLEQARITIARLAEVKSEGVIFTSSATEANALAIQGRLQALTNSGVQPQDIHVLYLPTAHASVIQTMHTLASHGMRVEPLVLKNGAVDLHTLARQITPETVLVSMDLVCGETGTKYDTRDVRRVLDAARKGGTRITLHIDASQAPVAEPFELTRLGADLLSLDAQKVGGVRGIGALIRASHSTMLAPLIYGGGQEQGLRPGTESPALASAFAASLQEAHQDREAFVTRARSARESFVSIITTAISAAIVNEGAETIPNILNFSFPGIDTDYAVMLLSEAGFAVSTKSACETDEGGSRVVLALASSYEDSKVTPSARATSTLRISWGPSTDARALQECSEALIKTISTLSKLSLSYS